MLNKLLFIILGFGFSIAGCVLDYDTRISRVDISRSLRLDRFPNGRSVWVLIATAQLTNAVADNFNASLAAYKCGGDRFRDAVGGGLMISSMHPSIAIPIEHIQTPDHNGYDMKAQPFDVCVYIVQPQFPIRRESNIVRIPASEITGIIQGS